MSRVIGILGGTFDPIHLGHLRPALEVWEQLELAEMRIIPCHIPPHRRAPQASVQQRVRMVELAVQGQTGFTLDLREVERAGPSYSVDTLTALRAELGEEVPLCLIMGMDAFAGLPSWHRWTELIERAHLVVTHRPGSPASQDIDLGDWLERVRTEDPRDLHTRPCGRVWFCPVTQLDISATDIRRRIKAGRSPRFLLPDSVWEYIRAERLYR